METTTLPSFTCTRIACTRSSYLSVHAWTSGDVPHPSWCTPVCSDWRPGRTDSRCVSTSYLEEVPQSWDYPVSAPCRSLFFCPSASVFWSLGVNRCLGLPCSLHLSSYHRASCLGVLSSFSPSQFNSLSPSWLFFFWFGLFLWLCLRLSPLSRCLYPSLSSRTCSCCW